MRPRIAVAGLGVVGKWLLRAIERGEAGDVEVVHLTSGRDGREADLERIDFDALAVCTNSPSDGEPGTSLMRTALAMGAHVVASDKWPVALHGVELGQAAGTAGVAFRAEATVMSGTPLFAPLFAALSGRRPTGLRGVVNATVNEVLTRMAAGEPYEAALASAQERGLAEPDPSADVDGRDEEAKAMILAALVFGHQLERGQVRVRGISSLEPDEVSEAVRAGRSPRSVTAIAPGPDGSLRASVKPVGLPAEDPLAAISGIENAVLVHAEEIGEIGFRGPGAGPEIAGKGVLDDLRAALGREGATSR